jgi:glycosyltransferase involved in cell wall biosynthesis
MPPLSTDRPAIAAAPLSLVLAAHNEGIHFQDVVKEWIAFLETLKRDYEVLLVEDGSSDDTGKEADGLGGQCNKLRVFHHPERRGLGAALRTGIEAAQYPLLAYTTCNKDHLPGELQRFLDSIDKVDLATGYRIGSIPGWLVWLDRLYRLFARVIFGMSRDARDCWPGWSGFCRRLLGRWVFGVRVRDPECAFCLARRQIFARIPIQANSSFALIEILAKANFQGCLLGEVPVTFVPGKTKAEKALESSRQIRREMIALFRRPDFGPALLSGNSNPTPVPSTNPPG